MGVVLKFAVCKMEGESKKKEPLVVVDSKAEIIGKLSRSVDPFTKDYYKLACRILLPRNVDNDNDFSKLYEMAENSLGEEECIRFTCSIFREAGYNNHGLTEFAEKTLGYNVREYNVRKVYPRVDLILTTYNFICNLDPNDPRNDFQSFQSFVCLKTGVDRNGYNTPFLLVKLCFDEGIIPEDGNISEMLKLSEIYNRGYYFKHYCTRQGFTKEGNTIKQYNLFIVDTIGRDGRKCSFQSVFVRARVALFVSIVIRCTLFCVGLSMNKSNSKETKNKPSESCQYINIILVINKNITLNKRQEGKV